MIRRSHLALALACVAAIAVLLLGYAYFIEPRRLVVTNSTIAIKGWDPAFNGLRIVAIGDIHAGSHYVTEDRLREVVKLANEQEPDIIVLLGDYVAQDPLSARRPQNMGLKMPLETIAANLGGLHARLGVFAVLGNHDGWCGDDIVAKALSDLGYKVLQNEVATITEGGHSLRILGFKDHLELNKKWSETSADAREWLKGGQGNVIALEHSPDIMPIITGPDRISDDLKLVLAAHTHGGQVWLPVLGRPVVPSTFGQKYAYGHIIDNNVDLFVTSGVGMSVLPFRFMVPPEIAVLTIVSAGAPVDTTGN